jgi:hypothetical protein
MTSKRFRVAAEGYASRMSEDRGVEDRIRDEEQEIASGRSAATPFVVVGAVAVTIAVVVALVVALVFVVFWLA